MLAEAAVPEVALEALAAARIVGLGLLTDGRSGLDRRRDRGAGDEDRRRGERDEQSLEH